MSSGYSIKIPIEVIQSMSKIININITDEEKDYNQCEVTGYKHDTTVVNHIYHHYELVNRFLHSQDLQAEIDYEESQLEECPYCGDNMIEVKDSAQCINSDCKGK